MRLYINGKSTRTVTKGPVVADSPNRIDHGMCQECGGRAWKSPYSGSWLHWDAGATYGCGKYAIVESKPHRTCICGVEV